MFWEKSYAFTTAVQPHITGNLGVKEGVSTSPAGPKHSGIHRR